MAERFGYSPFFEALAWMRKNRGRDVTTAVGGLMGPGIHRAIVQEYRDSADYRDWIFRSSDKLLHKERTWGRGRERYKLGSVYELELVYGGDGSHRIEAAGDQYKLVHSASGDTVFAAASIREVYSKVKELRLKLTYLKIKWSRLITKEG